MDLHKLLACNHRILSDGSMYELLRRSPQVRFDTHIAHAGLLYGQDSRRVLEGVLRAYIEIGTRRNLPMAIGTTTWRANRERVAASGFASRAVNEDNAGLLIDLCGEYARHGARISIGGVIGPRGDAYKPAQALDIEAARDFHTWQIEALAQSGVDYLHAATLPALSEARGIARAIAKTGLPGIVSFVIGRSGRLLDGTLLEDAIGIMDTDLPDAAIHYAVNCVHPSVMRMALERNPGVLGRLVAFSGNTSARSVDELDGLEELETEDPAIFAEAHRQLLGQLPGPCPIPIIGGCCGTDPSHMEAIADSVLRH